MIKIDLVLETLFKNVLKHEMTYKLSHDYLMDFFIIKINSLCINYKSCIERC
jgi:hypothetical protein